MALCRSSLSGWLLLHVLALMRCSVVDSQVDNPFMEILQTKFSLERLDQCFCELTGRVDECCCDVETVDTLNREKIYPLISSLMRETYFRFFKVNLNRPCPFWPEDGRCVLRSCHVEKCTEDEIPAFLKGEVEEGAPVIHGVMESCDQVSEEERQLSVIDSTISLKQLEDFKTWQAYDDVEENFCELDADSPLELSYVDLILNPERYTGYAGHSPHRIWGAIYHENCFRPEGDRPHPSMPLFDPSLVQAMCLEKRAFFRVISGMHASINTHLSALYITSGKNTNAPTFGPNLNEFVRRFDAATTNGQGPSWLKNLYFAYLVVLRAVTKTESFWQSHQFYTGSSSEDQRVKERVTEIVQTAKSCSSQLFDETMLFTGNTSQQLKNEFRAHFKNISRIMDCVGCDKCKLWGKLQVQGVGTALKILFSGKRNNPLYLTRSEIVSLFNVLGRFSSSLHSVEMFREMLNNKPKHEEDQRTTKD